MPTSKLTLSENRLHLTGGTVYEYATRGRANVFLIKSPGTATAPIYVGKRSDTGTAEFEGVALPGSWGGIVRRSELGTIFLYTATTVAIQVMEIHDDNPFMYQMMLWSNMRLAAEGTPGAVIPSKALLIAGSDGTYLQNIKVTNAAADALSAAGAMTLDAKGFLYGFNGTTWDRIREMGDNSDTVGVNALGILAAASRLMGFDGTNFVRLRAARDNTDGVAVETIGLLEVLSKLYGYNGTSWDRIRATQPADATTSVNIPHLLNQNRNTGYNGATWDLVRVAKINKYVTADAVATGAASTLWTPASGKKFRILGFAVCSSNAGPVTLLDGANVIATVSMVANDSKCWTLPDNGYISTAADAVLTVRNDTGGNSNLRANAIGTEE